MGQTNGQIDGQIDGRIAVSYNAPHPYRWAGHKSGFGRTPVSTPNNISIRLAAFVGLAVATNRQTDTQTTLHL